MHLISQLLRPDPTRCAAQRPEAEVLFCACASPRPGLLAPSLASEVSVRLRLRPTRLRPGPRPLRTPQAKSSALGSAVKGPPPQGPRPRRPHRRGASSEPRPAPPVAAARPKLTELGALGGGVQQSE